MSCIMYFYIPICSYISIFPTVFMTKCQTCTQDFTQGLPLQWGTLWWPSLSSSVFTQSGWTSFTATELRGTQKVIFLLFCSYAHLDGISKTCSSSSYVRPLPLCRPALRFGYEEEEADLPKVEDLQGAARGLMRLQDVYALQVSGLSRGRFQRITKGEVMNVCLPDVSVSLSGDDCFMVGKVN